MKANIIISEGCTTYSYCINEVEWVELTDKESKNYNPDLVNAVCEELLDDLCDQVPNIPAFLIRNLYNVDNANHDILFSQDIFIDLVKINKNTKYENLGTCEECGDLIETYELNIEF